MYMWVIVQKNPCFLSDCNRTRPLNHDHLVQKRTLILPNWQPIWLNGWVFVYELSGFGFGSCCRHLNFRYRACCEQGVPWHSGNHRVRIYSETYTLYDKNIQPVFLNYFKKLFFSILAKWLLFMNSYPGRN